MDDVWWFTVTGIIAVVLIGVGIMIWGPALWNMGGGLINITGCMKCPETLLCSEEYHNWFVTQLSKDNLAYDREFPDSSPINDRDVANHLRGFNDCYPNKKLRDIGISIEQKVRIGIALYNTKDYELAEKVFNECKPNAEAEHYLAEIHKITG